jgi:sulfur carrier protein ThiS
VIRIFLGGHLNFYHPQKDKWLEVEVNGATSLTEILNDAGIPLAEVNLVSVNGDVVELEGLMVSEEDDVRLYSATGGG